MAYGVSAYAVRWDYFETYFWGSKRNHILRELGTRTGWSRELNELAKSTKSISPKKAVEDFIKGEFSRSDEASGTMYRYVLEKLFEHGNWILSYAGKAMPSEVPKKDIFMGKFIQYGMRMNSTDFYSIGFDSVSKLFDYEEAPLQLPASSDFPITSRIPYDEVVKLRQDFSKLNLPQGYHEEFKGWLQHVELLKRDMFLFYY